MAAMYRLTYDAGDGMLGEWEKTAEELLVPNGSEPLIAWMLREADARGAEVFTLERIPDYSALTDAALNFLAAAAAQRQDLEEYTEIGRERARRAGR